MEQWRRAQHRSLHAPLKSMQHLDGEIDQLLDEYAAHGVNRHWGFLSRAGFNDKSHIMRQIEKYADLYTSRVSNFYRYTPYAYFNSGLQSLAHDTADIMQGSGPAASSGQGDGGEDKATQN